MMIEGEKRSRQGLHTVGSAMIVLGFMTILAVLLYPAWLTSPLPFLDFDYSYAVGLVGAIMMIIFGAVISDKARGKAKVRGFMLYGDAIDEVELSERQATREKMNKDDE